mmetsp:Transcript_52604/g.170993  ORF Transcript_52604/g.170993 Transcript_52604/m.170993 type:complete len:227 (-) Transcript_52604:167-847(-)
MPRERLQVREAAAPHTRLRRPEGSAPGLNGRGQRPGLAPEGGEVTAHHEDRPALGHETAHLIPQVLQLVPLRVTQPAVQIEPLAADLEGGEPMHPAVQDERHLLARVHALGGPTRGIPEELHLEAEARQQDLHHLHVEVAIGSSVSFVQPQALRERLLLLVQLLRDFAQAGLVEVGALEQVVKAMQCAHRTHLPLVVEPGLASILTRRLRIGTCSTAPTPCTCRRR